MRDQRDNVNGIRCMVKPPYTNYAQINIFDRKTLCVINVINNERPTFYIYVYVCKIIHQEMRVQEF